MRIRTWRCEVEACPIKHVAIGYVESATLENMLGAVRCLFCLVPMVPIPPDNPDPQQPIKN